MSTRRKEVRNGEERAKEGVKRAEKLGKVDVRQGKKKRRIRRGGERRKEDTREARRARARGEKKLCVSLSAGVCVCPVQNEVSLSEPQLPLWAAAD